MKAALIPILAAALCLPVCAASVKSGKVKGYQPKPSYGSYSRPVRGYRKKDGTTVRPHTSATQPGRVITTPSKPSSRPPHRRSK